MLSPARRRAGRGTDAGGFTLIELMIVVAIMAVVLVVASNALISLSRTTTRGSAMITDEQSTSTILNQLAKDIRSAHTLSFPAGATPANQVVLQDNTSGGGTTQVEWLYQPGAATLTRQVPNSSGTFVPVGPFLAHVANSGAQPIFTYLGVEGANVSTSTNTTIANCTTRIEVDLLVRPPRGTTAVANFQETADVALTDQLAILSDPGNGQC